ncbi:MAG: cyanophycinase [Bacteroidales bacterium]|nr:cyanophycinase [Bacteroidales bacterium]
MNKISMLFAIILLLHFTSCTQNKKSDLEYLPEKIDSKGTLVIEGGGDRIEVILKTIIKYGGGDSAKLLVVPFASGVAEETGIKQSAEFRDLGCTNSDYIFCSKDSVDSPESLAKLDGVTAIFFSGGDQVILSDYLEGTKFLEKIREIYKNGGVISGTSAGAAIMSRIMLTGTSASDTSDMPEFNYIKENDVITAPGFAFLNNIIIDQHFITRKRQVRLINVLLDNPGYRGIGIDEEAAIVVKPDNTMEVIGTNRVMVFEPYKPDEKTNGAVNSFKLTLLSPGDKYNF